MELKTPRRGKRLYVPTPYNGPTQFVERRIDGEPILLDMIDISFFEPIWIGEPEKEYLYVATMMNSCIIQSTADEMRRQMEGAADDA